MRGRPALSVRLLKNKRQSPVDPSSVGYADTFSRKGRRILGDKEPHPAPSR
jgi:hypothetical protein